MLHPFLRTTSMEGFLLREAGLRIVANPEFFCPLSKRYVSDYVTLGLVNFTELLLEASAGDRQQPIVDGCQEIVCIWESG